MQKYLAFVLLFNFQGDCYPKKRMNNRSSCVIQNSLFACSSVPPVPSVFVNKWFAIFALLKFLL